MFFGIMLFIFVVVCILLCLLILIQSDKGGGISGAIGGGLAGASSMFGTQDTANVLTRTTAILASIFMGLCIIMSIFLSHPSAKQQKSMLKERAEKQNNFSPSSVLQGNGLPLGASQQTAPGAHGPGTGAIPLQQQSPAPAGLPMAPAPAPMQAPAKAPAAPAAKGK
ncbi:MAG: preprotein translocase subunit SecG [Chitinivibrionales bacterium]